VTSVALEDTTWADPASAPVLDAVQWVVHAPSPALAVDADGRIGAANGAMARLLGSDAAQLVGKELARWSIEPAALRGFLATKGNTTAELRFRAADGVERSLLLSIATGTLAGGRVVSAVDMTAQRSDERRLRAEIGRFRDMIAAGSGWFHEIDRSQTQIRVFRRGLVNSQPTLMDTTLKFPGDVIDPAFDPKGIANAVQDFLDQKPVRNFLHRPPRSDGKEIYLLANSLPFYDENGIYQGHRGVSIDVTAQVLAERTLRRVQQHLERAQRVAAIGSVDRDLVTGAVDWSEEMYHLLGVDRSFERTDANILALAHPEERARVVADMARLRSGVPSPPGEYRMVRPNGETRIIHMETEFQRDAAGKPVRLLSIFKDVTALRTAERRQREQLQHSQKLEALGTLAGGVAHDLNNTLVPILALTKIVAKRLPEDSRERTSLATVIRASERARDLVKQILAFSRKEAPTRKSVDLSELVAEALKMLRASIPSTIAIAEKLGTVPPLLGDPGQLHQVITNLVTNAAHAIGGKIGTITVEVAPAPGEQITEVTKQACGAAIRLSVIDTGCGMDKATLARIYEPFFTTKGVGEGTGLGLSMVHGIVGQHGGCVKVSSRLGEGTRFDLYLPALEAHADTLLGRGRETAKNPAFSAG
jgi:PAS domain S-box-containing protein